MRHARQSSLLPQAGVLRDEVVELIAHGGTLAFAVAALRRHEGRRLPALCPFGRGLVCLCLVSWSVGGAVSCDVPRVSALVADVGGSPVDLGWGTWRIMPVPALSTKSACACVSEVKTLLLRVVAIATPLTVTLAPTLTSTCGVVPIAPRSVVINRGTRIITVEGECAWCVRAEGG